MWNVSCANAHEGVSRRVAGYLFYDGISLFAVSKKICLFAIFNYILVKKCDKIFGEAEYQC